MQVYRCVTDDADYIGLADSGPSVLIVVHEADSTDGYADAAELELTGSAARKVAAKLRELLAGVGKAGEVCGVFVGRTSDDPGILVCVGVEGGSSRSVILSNVDVSDFADRLTVTASETDNHEPDTTPANHREDFAELTRRAAALKITATVFQVAEVDLFEAAEWVVTESTEEAA